MGKNQQENEELIKYGIPEDVWFHVDELSSAHVYLRQKPNDSKLLDDLDPQLVTQCAALVKANSIAGCKVRSVAKGATAKTRWRQIDAEMDLRHSELRCRPCPWKCFTFHASSFVPRMAQCRVNELTG